MSVGRGAVVLVDKLTAEIREWGYHQSIMEEQQTPMDSVTRLRSCLLNDFFSVFGGIEGSNSIHPRKSGLGYTHEG